MKKINKKNGFAILSIILSIVILTVVISAWTSSGTIRIDPLSADIKAVSVINDGLLIKQSYDNLIVRGLSPTEILFVPNSTNENNVLNPITGANWPRANGSVLESNLSFPFGYWIYNPNKFIGNNIGTSAPDPAILIQGITDAVCKRINYNLYRSEYVPSFGFSGNIAIMVANATMGYPVTDIANQQYALGGTSGWMNGCVKAGITSSGANNFYFQILRPT